MIEREAGAMRLTQELIISPLRDVKAVRPGVFERAIRDNMTKLSHYPLTHSALNVVPLGHAFAQSAMQRG
jgi:hypothetical protein